ncbi:MAG: hypothetical protein J6W96_05900, partial [Alphaproteobacteria bacterium]|nr:hypothetical protein [Alphaproteobacteria bacterium]
NSNNQKMQTIYQKTDTGIILCFPDLTQIIIDQQGIRTFHKGIELTYETKNSFALSYQPTGLTPPSKGRE